MQFHRTLGPVVTRSTRTLIAGCLALLLTATAFAGNTIHVPADFATIQSAIDAAGDGDEIIVAPGEYNEAINFLGKAITVRSSDGRDMTTISALTLEQPVSVVTFASGEGRDSILDGFTISGGHGTLVGTIRRGGGIYITESDPTIQNCRITGNHGQYGAGLGAHGNTNPLIVDCEFIGNVATGGFTGGGGAMITVDSTGHILNCVFSGNSADAGGGLAVSTNSALGGTIIENSFFSSNAGNQGAAANVNTDGSAAFVDCTFQSHGPGVSVGLWNGPPGLPAMATFENCVFQGNNGTAIAGGTFLHVKQCSFIGNAQGVSSFASGGTVIVEDSLFQNNTGNGAVNLGGFASVSRCTFIGNSSGNPGGAVRYGFSAAGANLLMSNSTFIANSAPIGGAVLADGPATIQNSVFEENVAGAGGAIRIWNGLIEDCIIRNNSATSATEGGGGVLKWGGGTVTIASTLIENNTAAGGGGIRHQAGDLTVVDSTIVGNSAAVGGGAMKASASGVLRFESTLFCENDPDDIEGAWIDLGGNSFHDECPECGFADLNCDGSVGVADLLILLAAWGRCADCAPGQCPTDLTGDCAVGVADLLLLLANWG